MVTKKRRACPSRELSDIRIEVIESAQTRRKRRSRKVAPTENALSTILTFGKAVGREQFRSFLVKEACALLGDGQGRTSRSPMPAAALASGRVGHGPRG